MSLPIFKLNKTGPDKLFPTKEIRKNKKLLGNRFFRPLFFGTKIKEWNPQRIDISLHEKFRFQQGQPLGSELAWIRMDITNRIIHHVPLPRIVTDLLHGDKEGNFDPHVRISGFSISRKLRGNSIGSSWYNQYIEPSIIASGINIIRVEGSCLNRNGFRFWQDTKQGFSKKFLVTEEVDYDDIEFYNTIKVINPEK